MTPVRTGIALAITVALFYCLCTLAALLWPGPFLWFVRALFHGMDVQALPGAARLGLSDFACALFILSAWAFFAGSFFSWVKGKLAC